MSLPQETSDKSIKINVITLLRGGITLFDECKAALNADGDSVEEEKPSRIRAIFYQYL